MTRSSIITLFTVSSRGCPWPVVRERILPLGERRAAAVKDYLVSLGIGADRILAISKGEEQPVCTEMTEPCYAMNRRGHFIITAK